MKRKQHRIIAFILAFITVILMGCSSTSYHNDLTEKPVIYLYPEDITEDTISSYLDTRGIPDPDLLIRTSGEIRLSNYLLWQLAYTEFYFTDVLWPDFNKEELKKAIVKYNQRDRRFGGVK